jgi:hypothetical protein
MRRREEGRGATRQLLTGYAASVTLRWAPATASELTRAELSSHQLEVPYMETPRVEPELTSSRLQLPAVRCSREQKNGIHDGI